MKKEKQGKQVQLKEKENKISIHDKIMSIKDDVLNLKSKKAKSKIVKKLTEKTKKIKEEVKKVENLEKIEKAAKNYDISIFSKNWRKILSEIKKESVMLGALSVESKPDRVEEGVLFIRFPSNQKFHSEQLMIPEKKVKVEKVINQICNSDIEIKTFFESDDAKNGEDKFLKDAVKFFDGEILEKK